jgi:hypothetical protein
MLSCEKNAKNFAPLDKGIECHNYLRWKKNSRQNGFYRMYLKIIRIFPNKTNTMIKNLILLQEGNYAQSFADSPFLM